MIGGHGRLLMLDVPAQVPVFGRLVNHRNARHNMVCCGAGQMVVVRIGGVKRRKEMRP